jgi:hypothetical protein
MDQSRQQAYLSLIKQLLACRNPDELEPCLHANSALLDVGLVQSVIEYGNLCEQEGEDNAAHTLNALAKLLANILGLQVLTETQLRQRHQLLVQVLQASSESQASAAVVYPILQAHLTILDQGFVQVLHNWIEEMLTTTDANVSQTMTSVLRDFGHLIADFPAGDPTTNTAIAELIAQRL